MKIFILCDLLCESEGIAWHLAVPLLLASEFHMEVTSKLGGEPGKMTKMQELFVQEYLIDLNATQAAIRAGYSPATAQQIGSELLTKPHVKKAVARAMAVRSRRIGVTADRVVMELAKVAFVNPADVINFREGTLKNGAEADDVAAVQSVKVKHFGEDGVEREIKLADKLKALELLGRHLGMFNDNLNINGSLQTEKTKLDSLIEQLQG